MAFGRSIARVDIEPQSADGGVKPRSATWRLQASRSALDCALHRLNQPRQMGLALLARRAGSQLATRVVSSKMDATSA